MNDAATGPRSVPQILDGALRLYFSRFGLLFGIAAGSGVITWLLTLAVPRMQLPPGIPGVANGVGSSFVLFIPFLSFFLPLWWVSLISTVAALWAAVAIVVAADAGAEFQDESMELGKILGTALRRLWPFIVTAIAFYLVTMSGFILLLVPGVIFGTRWSVAMIAAIVEERGASSALGRSWDLVRGLFWHAFGAAFLAAVATVIIGLVLQVPTLFALAGGRGFSFALGGLWEAAVGAATTPYMYCVLVLLMLDLRARKEGTDITYGGA